MSNEVPKSHPRYHSLVTREKIVSGVEKGITSIHGLIAHGRGEAFNYLFAEQTQEFARIAIEAAAGLLREAECPVISVNGNVAALVPEQLIQLSELLQAPLEVNIFHPSKKREEAIVGHLKSFGAKDVLLAEEDTVLQFIDSNRRFVNSNGIKKADVVFVPLEDGDRCEALIKEGKKVITVDLNPLSRTARTASVTIVDDVIRAMPLLIDELSSTKQSSTGFRNLDNLELAKRYISSNLC